MSVLGHLLDGLTTEIRLRAFGNIRSNFSVTHHPVEMVHDLVRSFQEMAKVFSDSDIDVLPGKHFIRNDINTLLIKHFNPNLMERLCVEAFVCWTRHSEEWDMTEVEEENPYWVKFKELMTSLHSLQLFYHTLALPLATIVHQQVERQVSTQCTGAYDVALLKEVTSSVCGRIIDWLTLIDETSPALLDKWKSHLMHFCYKYFIKMRISELFEIIVDYPDSEPAVNDLTDCLRMVIFKERLISSLDTSFRKRLLHQGVNTADIITQYIASIKALRVVDPTGVVLERVCSPVREYLYRRDDTVRCIVASLTNDSESELVEALNKGDNDADSDNEEQDFDSWEPDPVDANPGVLSATRRSADIISLLVNIYGSCQMFVSEYRNMLADRLLQMCSYNISREVCTLELLKQRFGENSLHFCEVMLKDVGDSKRLSSVVSSRMLLDEGGDNELQLQGIVISSEFWPAFKEETFEIPDFVQRKMDIYSVEYKRLKGMRCLKWKVHLGLVEVEVVRGDQILMLSVSPIRAVLIHQFQKYSQWSVDSLAHLLKAHPRFVRKNLGFWVSQGLLKELSSDVYGLIQEQKFISKVPVTRPQYEDESIMEMAEDDLEGEFQVYWNYIKHMLTNLGSLSLERIHSMLGMFGLQGNTGRTLGLNDLTVFLNKKILAQQLVFSNGCYSLP